MSSFGVDDLVITSDKRLKYKIEDMENGLPILRELKPKKYLKSRMNLTEEEAEDGKFQIGLIAQDLLGIKNVRGLHKLVTGGDVRDAEGNLQERPFAIKYNDIHIITLLAVKELDAIVKKQQDTIDVLTKRVILLEKKRIDKQINLRC